MSVIIVTVKLKTHSGPLLSISLCNGTGEKEVVPPEMDINQLVSNLTQSLSFLGT